MTEKYFVTGIGTGIGKTIVSAILTEKLRADYWKPIQAGDLSTSDSLLVQSLISNTRSIIHSERYQLNNPLSPHLAARLDGVEISLKDFDLPSTDNNIIVEGAGGLMVPINEENLIIDLIKSLKLPVIIISQPYLGSINHTLLTVNVLKQHDIAIKGIIFNGDPNLESEKIILSYTGINSLGSIPKLSFLNKQTIIDAGKFLTI